MSNELCHFGIKGQKWGVRRYQNPDGTLTPAGKRRYSNKHEDYSRAHSKKSVKSMSDVELRNRINRLQMEKQYGDMTKKKSAGEKAIKKFVATAGTLASVTAAYHTYKKFADSAVGVIGDYKIKDLIKGAVYMIKN